MAIFCLNVNFSMLYFTSKEVKVEKQQYTASGERIAHFTRTNKALLVSHALNNVISVFVSTFLVSYIYSISENYVFNVGLFYMANYIVMGIVMYVVSALIDRTNRVTFYRVAVVIRAIFLVVVIFIGHDLARYVALAGALHGFSEACYWGSYNVMKNELVSRKLMNRYSSFQQADDKIVSVIIPLILGRVMDSESFKASAIIVLVIVVIQLITTMFITCFKPENASFDMRGFAKHVKDLGDKKPFVKKFFVISFVYGFTTIINPLITILVMLEYNSNFSLGIFTSIFSLCTVIFIIIFGKFTKHGKRNWLFILSSALVMISAVALIFFMNRATIIIFNGIYSIFKITFEHPFDVSRNLIIKKFDMYEYIAEFQCIVEECLEVARVVAFFAMAMIGLLGATLGANGMIVALQILLVISIISVVAINTLLLIYERKLKKHELV